LPFAWDLLLRAKDLFIGASNTFWKVDQPERSLEPNEAHGEPAMLLDGRLVPLQDRS
jgi:hypothetical protein